MAESYTLKAIVYADVVVGSTPYGISKHFLLPQVPTEGMEFEPRGLRRKNRSVMVVTKVRMYELFDTTNPSGEIGVYVNIASQEEYRITTTELGELEQQGWNVYARDP